MFNFRYVFLLVLALFSNSVFSEDYYWSSFAGGTRYSSADSACKAQGSNLTATILSTGKIAECRFPSGNYYSRVYLFGDSCPEGHQYNSETGECLPPEPEQCEAGQTSSFEFLYCYNYDGGDGCSAGTSKGQPGSFCRNSCTYIPDFNPGTTDADCYSYQNGDGSSGPAVMCSVTAETNGSECSGDYTPDSPDNSCPSGTVSGVVNGKRVCVPSGDGGGDGGDNGGGDGDGTGGDGDGTGGDGDGTGGDGDGGDNGGGDGTGGNGGNGGNGGGTGGNGDGTGGDGDGTGGTGTGGDGDGDGEGGEGGSGEGVDNCPDGRCDFGDERGDPFGGEVRSFSDSLTAAMTGMKNSPLGNSIGNIHFPTGGTCPTGSSSINIGIGSIPIDFIEHCNFWEQIAPILSAVFLAFWAIIAVRVFLSA